MRIDNAKASFTIKQIFNRNITTDHMSKKGLHLNNNNN